MEEFVKDRMMIEYDVQEWEIRFVTCNMTPRVQDMQLKYENIKYDCDDQ